jgi:GT2 family glycosyltransferase
MMDRLGYPFCLGRIFDVLEEDRGQYDAPRPIFWASGTAILIRREMLDRTGLLDEGLWAHWEEIDLCWRLQLAGGGIYSVPASVIHHHSGWTLGSDRFLKLYLNHRNSLIVLIKHTGPFRLLWLLPQRAALEALTVAYGLLRLDWKRPAAVLCAFFWLGSHPGALWRGRRASRLLQRIPRREVEGRMYRRALVFQHFLRGVRSAGQLAPPAGAPTQKPAPAAGMP